MVGRVSGSPVLGAVLGATFGVGVFAVLAGWHGQLDRPRSCGSVGRDRTRSPARSRSALAVVGRDARLLVDRLGGRRGAPAGSAGWRRRLLGLRARRRRQLARSEAMAIWAEMLRDLLVSNAGLHEAIGKSARVAPPAIRDEVRALYVRAQRGDLGAALSRFADEMDDAIADTVVTALHIAEQRAVSDLGSMLAAVATSTREAVAMQLRINAARTRTYRTAQLIAIIVAFFVGLLVLTNRDYMEPFGTAVGQVVLAASSPSSGVSIWTMVVLSRPPRPPTAAHRRPLRCAGEGRMIWAALFAATLGAGVWLVARRWRRRRVRCTNCRPSSSRHARARRRWGRARRWHRLAARVSTGTSERRPPTSPCSVVRPARHTLDKLGYALVLGVLALVPVAIAPLLGVSPLPTAVAALLLAAAGWSYPDLEVRSRAAASAPSLGAGPDGLRRHRRHLTRRWRRRRGGVDGRGQRRIRPAVRAARGDAARRPTRRRKLWLALDELGERADIVPLRELAAAVDLAAEWGRGSARRCSPRRTRCVCASSPRPRPMPNGRPRRWASRRR